MNKRSAKDLLTDPALRARVAAFYRASPAPAAKVVSGAGTQADPIVVHVIEVRSPPYFQRPAFAVFFVALGLFAGGYLLQLS